MSNYGKIEKHIASLLNATPGLKSRMKLYYQKLNHSFYKRPYTFLLCEGVEVKTLKTEENKGNFWGYYDSSPELNGSFLTHSFQHAIRKNKPDASYLDILVDGHKVSEANSWNWQQGARLFWLNQETILHNIFQDGRYRTKIINLKNNDSTLIDQAIYAFDRHSNTAIGLNYKRLTKIDTSYGYFAHEHKNYAVHNDRSDGIFSIDIEKNKSELIISIDFLKRYRERPEMANALHGVNHIQIAPGGQRFMFLHRWYLKSGEKFSRLFTANKDGSDLHLLSDDGMVSHCNWKNGQEIIGWMHKYNSGNGYYLHQDRKNEFRQIGKNILTEDGHPSFSKCETYMLTDTYPDRYRMSQLLLFDFTKQKLSIIGSFYNPLSYHNEIRCDLHPRFSDDNSITFDTVYEGNRQQVKLDISKLL